MSEGALAATLAVGEAGPTDPPKPRLLDRVRDAVSLRDSMVSGPNDAFFPVEHCWHLADLEREGYAVRIRRLREELDPLLPDFDGPRIARERGYKSRSLASGIAAFRDARLTNIAPFQALSPHDWMRRGTQGGVGAIALCDIPAMMTEHDASHRQEIEAWKQARLQS